jgi:hypothetical protein
MGGIEVEGWEFEIGWDGAAGCEVVDGVVDEVVFEVEVGGFVTVEEIEGAIVVTRGVGTMFDATEDFAGSGSFRANSLPLRRA